MCIVVQSVWDNSRGVTAVRCRGQCMVTGPMDSWLRHCFEKTITERSANFSSEFSKGCMTSVFQAVLIGRG